MPIIDRIINPAPGCVENQCAAHLYGYFYGPNERSQLVGFQLAAVFSPAVRSTLYDCFDRRTAGNQLERKVRTHRDVTRRRFRFTRHDI